MQIIIEPIARVANSRAIKSDDFWGEVISEIILLDHMPGEVFNRIDDFSHLEIIYFFDQVDMGDIVFSGRPRGNPDYPDVGIFAQRKKDRPNRIGICSVKLLAVNGRSLRVKNLDAIDGTPVIDIKPVFKEFQPSEAIIQPAWVADLMKNYWR